MSFAAASRPAAAVVRGGSVRLSAARRGVAAGAFAAPRPVRAARSQARLSLRVSANAASLDTDFQPITLSDNALTHLKKLRLESGSDTLLLRMGVRQGGCSGMEYVMDFEKPENVAEGDATMVQEGFEIVVDPKSLLYLFGLRLDYSSELIGGGFKFENPNADAACGCGKSFNA